MKRFCLAIAVLLQSTQSLSAAPDAMQHSGVATHLGLGAALLARPAEPLPTLAVGTLRAAGVQPEAVALGVAPPPAQWECAARWRLLRGALVCPWAPGGRWASFFALHPFHTLHVETPTAGRIDIWGLHREFRTLRGPVSVALEGGGAVRAREHLSLTAGFRLLGYEPGAAGRLEGAKLDTDIASPFLGLTLRF